MKEGVPLSPSSSSGRKSVRHFEDSVCLSLISISRNALENANVKHQKMEVPRQAAGEKSQRIVTTTNVTRIESAIGTVSAKKNTEIATETVKSTRTLTMSENLAVLVATTRLMTTKVKAVVRPGITLGIVTILETRNVTRTRNGIVTVTVTGIETTIANLQDTIGNTRGMTEGARARGLTTMDILVIGTSRTL